eukprot:CAMPEP_0118679752 /NCGR_PEP_ID=MMETSP0800-20121206/3960_1 /TAXON_ID=210618 ORGANISM="Striatella unipunctata, Strain CCMP2910" /NCGR_SAMPLE_ID=MMETSP0800 /ASSEMBLY_ACC=CAM_ASM_000638 /LENGTH=435 /DNA_ID=CAMNT_0006575777 /DNA_START=228 /DNA_END=1535 /DNA_ORIENTATION=-
MDELDDPYIVAIGIEEVSLTQLEVEWTEVDEFEWKRSDTLEGKIFLGPDVDPLPSRTAVDVITKDAFEGESMDLFLLKLLQSGDPILSQTKAVALRDSVTTIGGNGTIDSSDNGGDGGDPNGAWAPPKHESRKGFMWMLVICMIAMVSAAWVYQRFSNKRRERNRRDSNKKRKSSTPVTVASKRFFEELGDDPSVSSRGQHGAAPAPYVGESMFHDDVSSIVSHSLYSIQESFEDEESDGSGEELVFNRHALNKRDAIDSLDISDSDRSSISDDIPQKYNGKRGDNKTLITHGGNFITGLDSVGLSVLQFDNLSDDDSEAAAKAVHFRNVWRSDQPPKQYQGGSPVETLYMPKTINTITAAEEGKDWKEKYHIPDVDPDIKLRKETKKAKSSPKVNPKSPKRQSGGVSTSEEEDLILARIAKSNEQDAAVGKVLC